MRSTSNGHHQVLGMNYRNRELVAAHNPKRAIAQANDKIASKQLLFQQAIQVPALIAAIRVPSDVERVYPALVRSEKGFVVKPARSAQGRGVIPFSRALAERVLPHQGEPLTRRAFRYYISRILHGEFSFGRPMDAALVEQRIRPDESWIMSDLPGPPDLRIIVLHGRPVMAMARLPTLISAGRANLHRGAVGLGIDLESGTSTHAIWREQPVTHHPDSGLALRGLRVAGFEECLNLTVRCAQALPLGYMGVDIMRDKNDGPYVIELNARPGLAIQLANQRGLGAVCHG